MVLCFNLQTAYSYVHCTWLIYRVSNTRAYKKYEPIVIFRWNRFEWNKWERTCLCMVYPIHVMHTYLFLHEMRLNYYLYFLTFHLLNKLRSVGCRNISSCVFSLLLFAHTHTYTYMPANLRPLQIWLTNKIQNAVGCRLPPHHFPAQIQSYSFWILGDASLSEEKKTSSDWSTSSHILMLLLLLLLLPLLYLCTSTLCLH